MFVYSVRASTVRLFLVIALTLTLLGVAVVSGGAGSVFASASGNAEYSYSGVRDEDDRLAFLSQFGIEVKAGSGVEEVFTMPEGFDRVLRGYNEVQKAQGLDLSKYVGKKLTRYTYEVENAACEDTVFVTLLIHRSRVVGCDLSSASPEGFVKPLTEFLTLSLTE